MIKKIKLFYIIFVLFLVIHSPLILISEGKIVENQQKITNRDYSSSETSKIEIYQYLKDGSLLKSTKIITTEQANKLISNFNLIVTGKKPIHQKIDLARQELKEIIDFNESLYNYIGPGDRNFLGWALFVGAGLGVVMGLQGYATPFGLGTHLFGLFCFSGFCAIGGGGRTSSLPLSGILVGLTIGYVGFLIKVLSPNINGAVILGYGDYLWTNWWSRR